MLAKFCHTLMLSLQGALGLPGEFSEQDTSVIFTWLMPNCGQGIKDLIAEVPLTLNEQHTLAKTHHRLPLHSLRYHNPYMSKVQCLKTHLRAI